MSIPGVANVAIWGQRDKQFQVLVDPDRLRANDVTLDAVVKAAGDAVVLEAGGFVDTPNQRIAVRHLPGGARRPRTWPGRVVDFRGGASIPPGRRGRRDRSARRRRSATRSSTTGPACC